MILTIMLMLQAASTSPASVAPPSTRATGIEDSGRDGGYARSGARSPANPRVNARIETRVDSRLGGSTPTPPRPSYTPLYGRPQ